MGTWGAGILDNDNSRDIYDEYFDLFHVGKSPAAIVRALKRDHLDAQDEQDRAEFWPAVALAAWECGKLDQPTLDALQRVVERGDGMAAWQADGPAAARQRQRALTALLAKVRRPNPHPRKPRETERQRRPFDVGACVAFRFPDGRWGGFVAMKPVAGWGDSSFIKVLNYRAATKPTLDVLEKRRWLFPRLTARRRSDSAMVIPLTRDIVKRFPKNYELIGRIKLRPDDAYDCYSFVLGDTGKIVAEYV